MIRQVISQLKPALEVNTLVIRAPATLPKFPHDYQKPIKVPLPFLPNQFAKTKLQHGQPIDYILPFIANKKEIKKGFIQLF